MKELLEAEARAVSEKNQTESGAAVAVAATLKDRATERGGRVD